MCIVDKAKLYVNTYLKLWKPKLVKPVLKKYKLTINKSDC